MEDSTITAIGPPLSSDPVLPEGYLSAYLPWWLTVLLLFILFVNSLLLNCGIPRHKKQALVFGLVFCLANFTVGIHSYLNLGVLYRSLKSLPGSEFDLLAVFGEITHASLTLGLVLFLQFAWGTAAFLLLIKKGRRKLWDAQ